jgi:probable rRNA maturation factor
MNLQVDISSASTERAPEDSDIRNWIRAALTDRQSDAEVSVRLVDVEEMSQLNHDYRDKNGPTNVLSFPAGLPEDLGLPLLGDIVICAPIVAQEAVDQGKPTQAHWAHMTVHGTLHLLGYDHIEDEDARVMERMETVILASLHFPCPYGAHPLRQEKFAT